MQPSSGNPFLHSGWSVPTSPPRHSNAAKAGEQLRQLSEKRADWHRACAAILVTCHIVEQGCQICACYFLSSGVLWTVFLLVSIIVTPTLVLNITSLSWVRQTLDFNGRACGQCVCYLMHGCLSSTIWRFLKLFFVYDASDFNEFSHLRFIEVYMKTLPFVLAQVSLIFVFRNFNYVVISLAILQLLCGAVSLALTVKWVKPFLNSDIDNCHLKNGSGSSDYGFNKYLSAVATLTSLICRIVCFAAFMSLYKAWILVIVTLHWFLALLWVGLQENKDIAATEAQFNPARLLLRRCLLAYLLLWERAQLCVFLPASYLYYFLFLGENIAAIAFWYFQSQETPIVRISALSIALFTGILLLLLTLWRKYITCEKRDIVDSVEKSLEDGDKESDERISFAVISDTTGYSSGRSNQERFDPKCTWPTKALSTIPPPQPKKQFPPSRLPQRKFEDRRPVSERSFTDNESSNSRNTNTLDSGSRPFHRNPTSGKSCSRPKTLATSESLSSLSCITLSPHLTSTPNVKNMNHQHSCKDLTCHCRIFDQHREKTNIPIEFQSLQKCPSQVPMALPGQRTFRILCANCLQAHDPLLTSCKQCHSTLNLASKGHRIRTKGFNSVDLSLDLTSPSLDTSTTDYPSDTEMTCTRKSVTSTASSASDTTYSTWPPSNKTPQMSELLQREFTNDDYVHAWLVCSSAFQTNITRIRRFRGHWKKTKGQTEVPPSIWDLDSQQHKRAVCLPDSTFPNSHLNISSIDSLSKLDIYLQNEHLISTRGATQKSNTDSLLVNEIEAIL